MTEQSSKMSNSADDAIRAALESVERLEREQARQNNEAPSEGEPQQSIPDDINIDDIEVLSAGDGPPSGNVSSEPPADDDLFDLDDDEPEPKDESPAKSSATDNAMLSAMIAAKNEAVEALTQTQQEAKNLRERLMRVSADNENAKKRQAREKQEVIRFANESLLKDLLPVLDNMDRAVSGAKQATEQNSQESEKTLSNLLEGFGLVLKQFQETLEKNGVEGFTALGKPFDPTYHEAVAQKEDTSVPHQTVIEEYQKGYSLNDRLVRPAMVIVSTGGPKPDSKQNPEQENQEKESGESASSE